MCDFNTLGLVEGVAETVWGAVQRKFAGWQESVWALSGLVISVVLLWCGVVVLLWGGVVVGSWNVVVLLTNGWDWGWGLVLVVVVLGWCRWTGDWGRTAITLESWVVPSFVISSIIILA